MLRPPGTLSPDGGGSDAAFQGFVRAIVEHNPGISIQTPTLAIKFWGIWNEPDAKQFWRGTIPQLVRMTKDARSEIIKNADLLRSGINLPSQLPTLNAGISTPALTGWMNTCQPAEGPTWM